MTKRIEQRRTFIKKSAALSGALAAGALGFPAIARGQAGPLKVGILHPVTGPLAYSGQLSRLGAQIAVEEINTAGGIKSLGAKIEPVYGDAQSKPEVGVAEVEKMNEAGVSAIVGAYASAICLATTQAAAKHNIPHVVDVGVADQIVERGLKTTFGFKIVDVIKHANPTRDFNNIVLRMKSLNPDIVIPANYYNEYALLVRTMKQQGVQPQAIFSVLGGAASSFKFVKEFPDVATGIIDVNHWYNPKDKRALALRKKVEGMKDQFFTYEVFLNYECVYLLADAIERARSTRREAIIDALAASTWDKTFMPYGPTKFVNGQNQGAEPLVMQVVKGDIEVVLPNTFAQRAPVFPWQGKS